MIGNRRSSARSFVDVNQRTIRSHVTGSTRSAAKEVKESAVSFKMAIFFDQHKQD